MFPSPKILTMTFTKETMEISADVAAKLHLYLHLPDPKQNSPWRPSPSSSRIPWAYRTIPIHTLGVAVLFRQGTPWSESRSWSMQSSWPIAWFFRSSHVTYTVSSPQIFIIIFYFLFNLDIPPTERENMNESCLSFLPCFQIYNDRNRLPTTHKYDLQPLNITKPGKHMIFPWCALFPAASCQAARLDCGRWEADRFRQMSPG